jgi:hypothetical protein
MRVLFMVFCICKFVWGDVVRMRRLMSLRCLAAIPIQFAEERKWGPVTSELPFLALLLGTIVGGAANIL